MLSPPEKTERADGTKIIVDPKTPALEQLRRLWGAVSTRKIGLLLPIFFSSWFYWVRLIYRKVFTAGVADIVCFVGVSLDVLDAVFLCQSASACVLPIGCHRDIGLYPLWLFPRLKSVVRQGTFDQPRLASPPFPLTDHFKSRIRYGFVFSAGLFTLLWIWVLIVQHDFETNPPEALDWTSPGFGRAFGVYIMLQTAGNMVQNYLYFLMGTLGDGTLELSRSSGLLRGVESWGAVCFVWDQQQVR